MFKGKNNGRTNNFKSIKSQSRRKSLKHKTKPIEK